jgi:hypothetical protein
VVGIWGRRSVGVTDGVMGFNLYKLGEGEEQRELASGGGAVGS